MCLAMMKEGGRGRGGGGEIYGAGSEGWKTNRRGGWGVNMEGVYMRGTGRKEREERRKRMM
jgi:hypothetical protein